MKYMIKIQTRGYNEYSIESDTIEEAKKKWDESKFELKHGLFQEDGEENSGILFRHACVESVGEPEIRKFTKEENIESVGEPEIREERKIKMEVIDAKEHKKMYSEIINLFEKYGFSVDEAVPHLHALTQIIVGVLKEKYGLVEYEMYEL